MSAVFFVQRATSLTENIISLIIQPISLNTGFEIHSLAILLCKD